MKTARLWRTIEVLEDRIAPAVTAIINAQQQLVISGAGDKVVLAVDPADSLNVIVDAGQNGTADFTFQKSQFNSVTYVDGQGSDSFYLDYKDGDPLSGGKPFSMTGGPEGPPGFSFPDRIVVLNLTGAGPLGTALMEPSNSADLSGTVTINGALITGNNLRLGFWFDTVTNLIIQPKAGSDALTLIGNAPDDFFHNLGSLTGTANGFRQSINFGDVTNITIDLGTGDGANAISDSLEVNAPQGVSGRNLTNLNLKLGAGDDTLKFQSTTLALPKTGGSLTFDAGSGHDTLIASSLTGQAQPAMTLDAAASKLTYDDLSSMTFASVEAFNLQGSAFNYIGAGSPSATEDVVLAPSGTAANAGKITIGTTTIDYTGPLLINHVHGLTVNTPAGADTFTLQASATPAAMSLSGTVAGGAYAQSISYSGANTVTIDLGVNDGATPVSDALTVNQLATLNGGNQYLTFKTGSGDDLIDFTIVSDYALPVSGGSVSVDAGAGDDTFKKLAAERLNPTELVAFQSILPFSGIEHFQFAAGQFRFDGTGTEGVVWMPSATTSLAGRLEVSNSGILSIDTAGPLTLTHLASLELRTPAGADFYTLGAGGSPSGDTLRGYTVSGVTLLQFQADFDDVAAVTIDLGAGDGAAGAADELRINSIAADTALQSLAVKLGAGDDHIFVYPLGTLNLPVAGGTFTVDGGGGSDRLTLIDDTDVTLANPGGVLRLQYGDGSALTYTNLENFELVVDSLALTGTGAETVTWQADLQDGQFAGGSHSGSLVVANSGLADRTISYDLDLPAPGASPPLTISDVHAVNLETVEGEGTFSLDAGAQLGWVTLSGTIAYEAATAFHDQHAASLTNVAVIGVDLGKNDFSSAQDALTVNSLAANGLTTLTVNLGNGNDTLELGSGLSSLQLGSHSGEGFNFDGGLGEDTIKVTSASPIVFGPYGLQLGGTGGLQYLNTEHFILDGGVNGQVAYTGDGTEAFVWSPDAALTQHGTATFGAKDLTYTGLLIMGSMASVTLVTPAGADAFTLGYSITTGEITGTVAGSIPQHALFGDIPTVTFDLGAADGPAGVADTLTIESFAAPGLLNFTLKTGAGDDKLTLQGLTNLKNSTWEAGDGNDTLEATADVSMTLAAASLSFTDNLSHTSDFGHLTLTGSAVEVAKLTGGAGANSFTIALWTGAVTVKGGDGNDTIDLSGGFIGTGSFQGEGNDDTFIVQLYDPASTAHNLAGAAGGAALDGGSGTDTVVAQGNLDMTLTDALLTRTIPKTKTAPASSISNTLISFEHAILGGGAGTNVLNARQFSGTATLSGEGGIDNLIGSKGGGDLFGFHAGATASEMKTKLYTRDNFFASPGNATDHLHATTKAGNILSFRYSPTAVTYTIPNAAGGTASVGGGLSIELTEGTITAVEGSIFGDHLTGNKKTNFLIGGKGNDVLKAIGFDYLFGGPGNDRLLGTTPFKFQDTNYPIPNSTGVPPV